MNADSDIYFTHAKASSSVFFFLSRMKCRDRVWGSLSVGAGVQNVYPSG